MSFLYWIPTSKPTIDRELIATAGLQSVLPGGVNSRPTSKGPSGDGRSGAVLIHRVGDPEKLSQQPSLGYYPDRQEWQKIDGCDAWIGWEKERLPTPETLERDKMTPLRKAVELCDGNQWLVPIAQRPAGNYDSIPFPVCVLPQSAVRKDGRWETGDIKKQYQRIWEIANEVFDLVVSGGKTGDGRVELQLDYAVEAVAANYRIGPTEAGILQLFETDGNVAWGVLSALIDLEQWKAILAGKSEAAA